jgi:hypothetical protein
MQVLSTLRPLLAVAAVLLASSTGAHATPTNELEVVLGEEIVVPDNLEHFQKSLNRRGEELRHGRVR